MSVSDQKCSTTDQGEGLSELDKFKIDLVRNARYHEDRERFFASVHRGIMTLVIVGGVLTVAFFTQQWPLLIGVAGALVTLMGTLALNLDGSARLHSALKHRTYGLLAQAEHESASLPELREQVALIYADEPPTMQAVSAIAYNGAMLAFDRPQKYLLHVNWWQRFWRNVCAFASTDFKTREELGRSD